MDPQTRQRRGEEFAEEIRRRQEALGHTGPMPSFMNLVTDYVIDLEDRVQHIERALHGTEGFDTPKPSPLNIIHTEGQHG